jgi:sulfoxide reductase catalytic subunit YedY
MRIHRKRGWNLPDRAATPEHVALNRRALMAAAGAGVMLSAEAQAQWLFGRGRASNDPWQRNPADLPDLPAAMRNTRYQPGRAISPEREPVTYNNFYEFGSNKDIWPTAQRMPTSPWTVKVDGMVEEPGEFAVDDLMKRIGLEERVYRLRCVEAWAMTVPWTGFQMSKLLEIVKPLGSAKYVRLETAQRTPGRTSKAARSRKRRTSSASSSPASMAARCRRRMAGRSAWCSRGNTGSSPASRSPASR